MYSSMQAFRERGRQIDPGSLSIQLTKNPPTLTAQRLLSKILRRDANHYPLLLRYILSGLFSFFNIQLLDSNMSVQTESIIQLESEKCDKMPQPPYPLHESVKDRLHPQYVDFYNEFLINAQQVHYQPVEVSRRKGNVLLTSSQCLPVGDVYDASIARQETPGPELRIRCFIPEGSPPETGWPVMLYFHGGGWVFGDLDSENNVCTHMCVKARCVVITTEYRLAPQDPYPAAVHDAWETFLWTRDNGASTLGLDSSRIGVSGSSAGANLAAAIVFKANALTPRARICSQRLVVPVLDNTADPSNNPSWRLNEHTASLSAAKMLWYRNHYLPNQCDRSHPDASPVLHPPEEFVGMPPTVLIIGGCDILSYEAQAYAQKVREAGSLVELHVMEGMPHPFLAMDLVLEAGRKAINLLCDGLAQDFA